MARQRIKHRPPPTCASRRIRRFGASLLTWGVAATAIIAVLVANPVVRRSMFLTIRQTDVPHLRAAIAAWGAWAPAASILLMVLHTAVPFPAELLTAANGAVFGFWGGLLVSWLGAMAGACVGFAIARLLGRAAVVRVVPPRMLRQVDAAMGDAGWEVPWSSGSSPRSRSPSLNAALGLTRLPWSTFLWTTAIGILPVEVAVVAVGDSIGAGTARLSWGPAGARARDRCRPGAPALAASSGRQATTR